MRSRSFLVRRKVVKSIQKVGEVVNGVDSKSVSPVDSNLVGSLTKQSERDGEKRRQQQQQQQQQLQQQYRTLPWSRLSILPRREAAWCQFHQRFTKSFYVCRSRE